LRLQVKEILFSDLRMQHQFTTHYHVLRMDIMGSSRDKDCHNKVEDLILSEERGWVCLLRCGCNPLDQGWMREKPQVSWLTCFEGGAVVGRSLESDHAILFTAMLSCYCWIIIPVFSAAFYIPNYEPGEAETTPHGTSVNLKVCALCEAKQGTSESSTTSAAFQSFDG